MDLGDGAADIDRYLGVAVHRGDVPGIVALVATEDRILYHRAFGHMDVANRAKMCEDTIFEIMSMTKPITSVAVMMLCEVGRLDLDDPISSYIPSLVHPDVFVHVDEAEATYTSRPANREISIRHLLTHTAGFGYAFSNYTLQVLEQRTGKSPRELPLLHDPGGRWTYGLNTRILGELVEVVTCTPLDDFFRTAIFSPLGMEDTFFALPMCKHSRWTTTHRREGGVLIERVRPLTQEPAVFGDYGLLSTAQDYATFLQMLLKGGALRGRRILTRDSVDLMMQNHIGELVVELQSGADPARSRPFPLGAGRDKFGLGFQIAAGAGDHARLRSPGSCSWAGLKNTHFWLDTRRGIVAVILMQVLPFYDEACIRVLRGFEERIYRSLS